MVAVSQTMITQLETGTKVRQPDVSVLIRENVVRFYIPAESESTVCVLDHTICRLPFFLFILFISPLNFSTSLVTILSCTLSLPVNDSFYRNKRQGVSRTEQSYNINTY